jgi:hypothetical protein
MRHLKKYFLLTICFCYNLCFAQIRPDITTFTAAQRTQLVTLMQQFITADVIEQHCNYDPMNMMDPHIHSEWDFLPFHRTYIEQLEDFLILSGNPQFVPLPKWDPSTCTPIEFQVIDADCASATCNNGGGPCNITGINWCPNIALPTSLTTNLCTKNLFTATVPFDMSNIEGTNTSISGVIESPWHNSVHGAMGAEMGWFTSPALPIFFLWHAYVDDKFKEWECSCTQSGKVGSKDLYMKDWRFNIQPIRDRGEEPSLIDNVTNRGNVLWETEDIWVRNQNDGLTTDVHENPEYKAISTNFDFVYVRIRNRGCTPSSATGNQVQLSWAKAGTNLSWPNNWNGTITSPALMGNLISTKPIPAIPAGGSTIIEFAWQPPNPATYTGIGNDPIFWADEPWHFCLLARITSPDDQLTGETSDLGANVKNHNNIAWKNLTVVDLDPNNIIGPGGSVDWTKLDKMNGATVIGGYYEGILASVYDFEFANPPLTKGHAITEEAEVNITLDNFMWAKWANANFANEHIEIVDESNHKIRVIGNNAKLKNLFFTPGEQGKINVKFNFIADKLSGQSKFIYHVFQKNSLTNKVVGGEKFEIKIPGRVGFYAEAGPDRNVLPNTNVTLNANDIGEPAMYNWYDEEGNLVYTGKTFSLSPTITDKYKLEIIALDGVKEYDEVKVNVKENYLLNISPNPATTNANIEYHIKDNSSSYLIITKPYTTIQNQYILNSSNSTININTNNFTSGLYNVVLISNGVAVDSKSLMVQ